MSSFLYHSCLAIAQQVREQQAPNAVVFVSNDVNASLFELYWKAHQSEIARLHKSMQISTLNGWLKTQARLNTVAQELLGLQESVALLYELHQEAQNQEETLLDFYPWGKVLHSDYREILMQGEKADEIITNTQYIKEIDKRFRLEEDGDDIGNEIALPRTNVGAKTLEQSYLKYYEIYQKVFEAYRAKTKGDERLSDGQLYNLVRKWIAEGKYAEAQFYIVGFYALNTGEQRVLEALGQAGLSTSYWNIDKWYTSEKKNHPAGTFYRKHLEAGSLGTVSLQENVASAQVAHYVHTSAGSTGNVEASCQAVKTSKEQVEQSEQAGVYDLELMVLLPNDALGRATLGKLQKEGSLDGAWVHYPQPLETTKLGAWITEFTRLWWEAVSAEQDIDWKLKPELLKLSEKIKDQRLAAEYGGLITHLRSQRLNGESIKLILAITDHFGGPQAKETEAVKKCLEASAKLNLTSQGQSEEGMNAMPIWHFWKMLKQASITLGGEYFGQAIGVLGVDECKNVRARQTIIVGAEDSRLPGKSSPIRSYLPFQIRREYNMPLHTEHDTLLAQQIWNVIASAKEVHWMHQRFDGGGEGLELSRYVRQWDYWFPEQKSIVIETESPVEQIVQGPIVLKKDEQFRQRLEEIANSENGFTFSSTLIYAECRLKFYYAKVLKLEVPEERIGLMDASKFGNLVHYSMEVLYDEYKEGKEITVEIIDSLRQIAPIVIHEQAPKIAKEMGWEGKLEDFKQQNHVQLGIAEVMIDKILQEDAKRAPFTLLGIEKKVELIIAADAGVAPYPIKISGKIDRLQRRNGVLEIVDYKTGQVESLMLKSDSFSNLDDVKLKDKVPLQAHIYRHIVEHNHGGASTSALVYELKKISANDKGLQELKEEEPMLGYRTMLDLLKHLHNMEEPIVQTQDDERCKFCDYKKICGK